MKACIKNVVNNVTTKVGSFVNNVKEIEMEKTEVKFNIPNLRFYAGKGYTVVSGKVQGIYEGIRTRSERKSKMDTLREKRMAVDEAMAYYEKHYGDETKSRNERIEDAINFALFNWDYVTKQPKGVNTVNS